MGPGQILKKLRPDGMTLEKLATELNLRCQTTYDRIDVWKMENGQRQIPGNVLVAWFDALGVPSTKRWETLAARLELSVGDLLSCLGLPVTEAAAPTEAV